MRNKFFYLIILLLAGPVLNAQTPVRLHPDNPHYFIFRGKPLVLISSAEHYGMVLNQALDYGFYLEQLGKAGFNQTRVFSGAYCEGVKFIDEGNDEKRWESLQNTLAPRPGQYITPWKRSDIPGYYNGGNKFDLDRWDENYFQRLKDFCSLADSHDVIVEIVLFTSIYTPDNWKYSPLNSANNINNTGDVPYNEFHLLKHTKLIDYELKMVRKIVSELNEFDNVYFEICNEPYWMKGIPRVEPGITGQQFLPEIDEWQEGIVREIVETEKTLPKKHLIAQNIANSSYKVKNLNPGVSILNFHYAYPPSCVGDNYQFDLPIGFDETADGCNAPDRRREAWAFMLSGGAVYSNLDWSFATDDLSGLGRNPLGRRVSGSEIRDQLKILAATLSSFDFIRSSPVGEEFRRNLPDGVSLYGLGIDGEDYLLYWLKTKKTDVTDWASDFTGGSYHIEFSDPLNGKVINDYNLLHEGGIISFEIPEFPDDLVMRIRKSGN